MHWQLVIWTVVALCGLAAAGGIFFAFRNIIPDLLAWGYSTLLPALVRVIEKRASPEVEGQWDEARKSGERIGRDH